MIGTQVRLRGPLIGETIMRDGIVLGKVTQSLGRYQNRYWAALCSDGLSYILSTRDQDTTGWCWQVKPAMVTHKEVSPHGES